MRSDWLFYFRLSRRASTLHHIFRMIAGAGYNPSVAQGRQLKVNCPKGKRGRSGPPLTQGRLVACGRDGDKILRLHFVPLRMTKERRTSSFVIQRSEATKNLSPRRAFPRLSPPQGRQDAAAGRGQDPSTPLRSAQDDKRTAHFQLCHSEERSDEESFPPQAKHPSCRPIFLRTSRIFPGTGHIFKVNVPEHITLYIMHNSFL